MKDEQKKLTDAKADLKKYEDAASKRWADGKGSLSQFGIQVKAALIATVFAFLGSLVLALLVHVVTGGNFTTDKKSEQEGLDQTEHGEAGFDFGTAYDAIPTGSSTEPKAAKVPPGGKRLRSDCRRRREGGLMKAWSELCMPSENPIDPDFSAVYPYVTTVQGNRFRFRGGNPARLSAIFRSCSRRSSASNSKCGWKSNIHLVDGRLAIARCAHRQQTTFGEFIRENDRRDHPPGEAGRRAGGARTSATCT